MALRKLALKSILNFGKYRDYTVSQCLSLNKHMYLIWVYYNSSNISFLPEILDQLGIEEKDRIEKPGKDPIYFEEHKKWFVPMYDEFTSKLERRMNKHEKIARLMKVQSSENKCNSKKRQQNRNIFK